MEFPETIIPHNKRQKLKIRDFLLTYCKTTFSKCEGPIMLRIQRIPIIAVIANIIMFYAWSLLFWNNDWVNALGILTLQIIWGIYGVIWLFSAQRNSQNKQKYFWLLLCIGVFLQQIGNLNWLFLIATDGVQVFNDLSDFIYLISYICFLIALIYRTKEISSAVSCSSHLFNIVIFMITTAAISIHFLIEPIIAISNNSVFNTIVTIGFSIIDFGILFVIIVLFYINYYSKGKGILFLIVGGFFLQVVADAGYAYLSITESYHPGSPFDLLWILALTLIGFSGYYATEKDRTPNWELKFPFKKKEFIFPYSSIILLIAIVIYNYDWDINALSMGLLVIMFLIFGRQIGIINKNNRLMAEYKFLAYHDALTGLNNRIKFQEDLENHRKKVHTDGLALLLVDLDRFKVVNDTLGHTIGDEILVKTSERLRKCVNKSTPIYRLGGDEFLIVLPETSKKQSSLIAENIVKEFQKPFIINDYEITVTSSIGISLCPDNGNNCDELIKNADAAMYSVKEGGRNNFRFCNTELNLNMERKLKLESDLRKAIERDQLSLFYQPKVDLFTKEVIGMEALLRWKHPDLGWVSPVEFIPIAEETGQILQIGEWVLRKACEQNKLWQEKGFPPLCVSVNVSVLQFHHNQFIKSVKKVLRETQLDPQYLELEITESIMQNTKESIEILQDLKEMGVKTSIDDFGTGYSSLYILQKIPIDTIKIDKSFIDDIGNSKQQSMVKTIINLGRNLHLNIVAEGIEHEHQVAALLNYRCTVGQGYLFSKAVAPNDFEKILLQNIITIGYYHEGNEVFGAKGF